VTRNLAALVPFTIIVKPVWILRKMTKNIGPYRKLLLRIPVTKYCYFFLRRKN
jgi:hypothetical protein